ncbi:hypothetical protein K493DRAFT_367689 [Basidiobolus meristosporus CBS 931.73]|uniref:Peptidase C51 domain-containing protein n=1 Tax=Basidiobolus meristosporus CBS 931.73 TaxID=1314790 RepID=A0A1Y1VWD9_9FUNG|nr:hypothetical protein K493DRAFT_367689 [Basidiobolus meristosporus CBS 931.73]|eukprot:ORX65306.1 hypothetical protein K493DRAFT_367689 [Basidiobolus meristosporus CBS 931.73]
MNSLFCLLILALCLAGIVVDTLSVERTNPDIKGVTSGVKGGRNGYSASNKKNKNKGKSHNGGNGDRKAHISGNKNSKSNGKNHGSGNEGENGYSTSNKNHNNKGKYHNSRNIDGESYSTGSSNSSGNEQDHYRQSGDGNSDSSGNVNSAGNSNNSSSQNNTAGSTTSGQFTDWADACHVQLASYHIAWSGDALTGASSARNTPGWTVSSKPKVPSIIVIQPGNQDVGSDSHVTVVERIESASEVYTSN